MNYLLFLGFILREFKYGSSKFDALFVTTCLVAEKLGNEKGIISINHVLIHV